jgi:hypothetical protein
LSYLKIKCFGDYHALIVLEDVSSIGPVELHESLSGVFDRETRVRSGGAFIRKVTMRSGAVFWLLPEEADKLEERLLGPPEEIDWIHEKACPKCGGGMFVRDGNMVCANQHRTPVP